MVWAVVGVLLMEIVLVWFWRFLGFMVVLLVILFVIDFFYSYSFGKLSV
jgi:hypothetical protein